MTPYVIVPMALQKKEDAPVSQQSFIRATYVKKLAQHGLIPLFLSALTPKKDREEVIKLGVGLLLVGGLDIDPTNYKAEPHALTDCAPAEADEFELDLASRWLHAGKPTFGICRGFQLLAVASGGSLHQHLPDLVSTEQHGIGEGKRYDDLINSHRHDVLIDEDSRAAALLGKTVIGTNSAHHQGVKEACSPLRIVGRSPAGIAEVIEHEDPSITCFAVQAHPEPFEDSFYEPLIGAFAAAVRGSV